MYNCCKFGGSTLTTVDCAVVCYGGCFRYLGTIPENTWADEGLCKHETERTHCNVCFSLLDWVIKDVLSYAPMFTVIKLLAVHQCLLTRNIGLPTAALQKKKQTYFSGQQNMPQRGSGTWYTPEPLAQATHAPNFKNGNVFRRNTKCGTVTFGVLR